MPTIKVLVVDDTIVYRKIVSDALKEMPNVEVVGSATNGKTALSRIISLQPDLVTLDIEMPEMNGIEVLEQIREQGLPTTAVMLSTLTQKGGEMTIKALELGAFDFIPKPDQGTMAENLKKISDALTPIVEAFKRQKKLPTSTSLSATAKPTPRRRPTSPHIERRISRPAPSAPTSSLKPSDTFNRNIVQFKRSSTPSAIIAIGISTGGPKALAIMMPMLTPQLNVPIVVVQHMPPVFTQSLAKSLNAKCTLEVKEAENGEPLKPNTVYIAPGGTQMKIVAGADGKSRRIKITDDPPENSCKPSADYLFRSVADHYVGRATGVIMTGMGSDGTRGLALMKKCGSTVIAQDKESCTVYGMPKEPTESGMADMVVPLEKIAEAITKTVI